MNEIQPEFIAGSIAGSIVGFYLCKEVLSKLSLKAVWIVVLAGVAFALAFGVMDGGGL